MSKFLDYSGLQYFYEKIDDKYIATGELRVPLKWDENNKQLYLDYTDSFKLTDNKLDLDLSNSIATGGGLDTDSNGDLKVDPNDFAGKTIVIDNSKMEVNVDGTTIKKTNSGNDKEVIYVSLADIADGSSIIVDNGKLKANVSEYVLPTASASTKGGVKIGNGLVMGGNDLEVLSAKVDNATIEFDEHNNLSVKDGVFAKIINGQVDPSVLPSYIDDVIEGYYNPTDGKMYEDFTPGDPTADPPTEDIYANEITPDETKIYVDPRDTNTYRWSGSVYVNISGSPIDAITNAEIDSMMGINS